MASILPRACENCRIRKIRCDKTNPCSSCVVAKLACTPQETAQLAPARSQAESSPSQTALQQIEERVSALEKALQTHNIAPFGKGAGEARSPSVEFLPKGGGNNNHEAATLFEGESSFASLALAATRSADARYGQSTASSFSQLPSAISMSGLSINHSTTSVSYQDFLLNGRKPPERFPQMRLPRPEIALHLLNTYRNRPSLAYLIYNFGSTEYLESLASNAFFPTRPISLGAVTCMHGLFYVLVKDFKFDQSLPVPPAFDLQAFSDLCLNNFLLGLESHEIMMVPSADNVRALEIGLLRAMEESKTQLAWTLMATAAKHLISLGYHRKSAYNRMSSQEAEANRRLFWRIFAHDRVMSLNLGRNTIIRDEENDIELLNLPADPRIRPWDEIYLQFLTFSRIQGYIYEELYSLSAAQRSLEERQSSCAKLDFMLREWRATATTVAPPGCYAPKLFNAFYNSLDVRYNAVLANAHLAAGRQDSMLNISVKCYEAARACLESHLYWFPAVKAFHNGLLIHGYASYALFYSTLTPIIVLFLHAMSQRSAEDIDLLKLFRDSLTAEESGFSIMKLLKGAEKTVRICTSFIQVAEERLAASPPPPVAMTVTPPSGDYAAFVNMDTFFGVQPQPQATFPDYSNAFGNGANLDGSNLTVGPQPDAISAFLNGWINEHQLPDTHGMDWNFQ